MSSSSDLMKASWVGVLMRLVWGPDGDELARRWRAIMRRRTRAYDPPWLPPGTGLTRDGCRRRLDREVPGCAVPRQHRYVPAECCGRPDQRGISMLAPSPLRCN